jgi:hypothetical protein
MTYQKQWVERDDAVPGYIYLLKALGFHGIVPGCVLTRVKIGLTRHLQNRIDQLEGGQAPCNYKVIRSIYVQNMAEVERQLHQQFKHRNVKLNRSREFFDLSPWEMLMVHCAFSRHDRAMNVTIPLASRPGLAKLLMLSGLGLLLFTAVSGQFHTPSKKTIHGVSKAIASPVHHRTLRKMH